jgi:hypothetical protein
VNNREREYAVEVQTRQALTNMIPDSVLEARGLPKFCFVVHPHMEQRIVMLKRGEVGYYKPDFNFLLDGSMTADDLNRGLNLSKAQVEAMRCGSIFGFHTPGSHPSQYKGQEGKV